MSNTAKFWMVWAPNGRAPTYKHASKQSAMDEAARLSSINPGANFFVLKAVGGFVAQSPSPEPITMVAADPDAEIPF